MNDLTAEQKDYAIFLPALSSFYSTFIGKQRFGKDYVDPSRIPAHLQMPDDTLEKLNWLSPDGVFQYKWSLYSAGHANLDLNTHIEKEIPYIYIISLPAGSSSTKTMRLCSGSSTTRSSQRAHPS